MMFGPSLPDQARDPEARAQELVQSQSEHEWDWSWPPGCATLREVPRGDRYTLRYVARIAELSLEIARNHSKLALQSARPAGPPSLPASGDDLERSFFAVAEDFHARAPRVRPASIAGYADYFATSPPPPLVVYEQQNPASADALFAWQRVAGANPMSLRRIAALPDDFPLTEAAWQRAIGGGSLAAALGAGEVYAVDHSILHGAPATRYLGRQKYLCGARAIFVARAGALGPVAIQLEPGGAVVTPADGVGWAAARYCFQVADANVHETMEHLGATHMVLEAVGVAARRQLASDHPLRRLIEPHIEGTFAINNSAKTSLIAPGGVIDRVFAARIDVAAGLTRAALDRVVLQDRAPALELKARGVDDPALTYPYRDDILAVYGAIRRFAEAYVRLYYRDDATVAGDPELRAWVAEVGSPIGGALKGIRPVETIGGLIEWMANIIHLASAQHAAVNFPQYPFFSWGANVAGAGWAPAPGPGASEADLLALMPPWDCLILQADTVFQLSGVYDNHLGDYPMFMDLEVGEVIRAFQRDLAAVEATLQQADQGRLLSYPFLRPSLIPASINI
jgi:arachidonate 15-lipoxygenase